VRYGTGLAEQKWLTYFDAHQCGAGRNGHMVLFEWSNKEGGRMEHRWSSRKSLQGSITLTLPPWGKVQADICDISLGGLAVTSPQLPIAINTVATLSFLLECDGRVSHHRLTAQVAHSDSARTGFLFMEPGNETLRALREILYSPASNLSAGTASQTCTA
jgi:hypothetical protein